MEIKIIGIDNVCDMCGAAYIDSVLIQIEVEYRCGNSGKHIAGICSVCIDKMAEYIKEGR